MSISSVKTDKASISINIQCKGNSAINLYFITSEPEEIGSAVPVVQLSFENYRLNSFQRPSSFSDPLTITSSYIFVVSELNTGFPMGFL